MKVAPRLAGFTACKSTDPPTGGRPGRFGAAVRGGPWPDLLRGRSTFQGLPVARSVMDDLHGGRSTPAGHNVSARYERHLPPAAPDSSLNGWLPIQNDPKRD